MKRLWFVLAWTFVSVVATYDALFAWHYRASFSFWELNPFMRWIDQSAGLEMVFVFKFVVLTLATAVAYYCYSRPHLLARVYTPIIVGVHVLLMTRYATACV